MLQRAIIINDKCFSEKKTLNLSDVIENAAVKLDATVIFTKDLNSAAKAAQESANYACIIALGGDGTISEIVNNMNLETQVLGIIPLGRGNSIARDLEINSLNKAVEKIKRNKLLEIDVIECQLKTEKGTLKRYAVATSGIGFACGTVLFGDKYIKSWGEFCYPIAACASAFRLSTIYADITADNFCISNKKITNLIVSNTRYAGNFCVFPEADLADAAFHLFCDKTNFLTQSMWNMSIITKTYFYNSGLRKSLKKLHIFLHKPSLIMIDGEIYGPVKEIFYSIVPKKLKIVA